MGFMDQFRQCQPNQSQQQSTPNLSNLLQQARQIVGDDPRAALSKMQDNGTMVNLPNGKVLPVKDVVAMADGKSAMQFLTELMR